ncbi:MAG TPA: protein kinase [Oligoflexia bacterium]|nr:protein kinase [Oligoflexia bacterium]HMP47852.1 protein kinase [Oligoflexia bacterium]
MSKALTGFDEARAIDGTLIKSLIGSEIEGYRLIEPLVVSKRTVVVKGKSERSGSLVALKFITQYATSRRPELIDQFFLEAKVHSELKSHRIAQFRRFCSEKACLVTSYLEGKTLEHYSDQSKSWILNAVYLICEPIEKLHNMGYLHCDLKPNNMILSNDKIRLIDFGSVCHIGEMDKGEISLKHILGTPGFISPEQMLRSGKYGPETDVFSLGCIILSMLTKRQFLKSAKLPAILKFYRRENPRIFSRRLVHLLRKALSENSRDRHSNVSEFKEELRSLIH